MVQHVDTPPIAMQGPSPQFMDAMQAAGDGLVKRIDAVGDMIFGALVEKLDAMTDNLKDKFSKSMNAAQTYVSNNVAALSEKASPPTVPNRQQAKEVEAPAKTPEIAMDVAQSAKNAVRGMQEMSANVQMQNIDSSFVAMNHSGMNAIGVSAQGPAMG